MNVIRCNRIITNDVWYSDLHADTAAENQVTDSAALDDRIKAVNDGVLVWLSDYSDIFFYDLDAVSPAAVQVTTDTERKGEVSFDAEKIVWNADGEIYGFDIESSDPRQILITDNKMNDHGPKTKDECIIWEANELTYAARW